VTESGSSYLLGKPEDVSTAREAVAERKPPQSPELVPGEEFVKEEKKPACFGWTCWIFMCLAVAVFAVVAALIQADIEQRQRAREHLASPSSFTRSAGRAVIP
jgi:type VI protein secretion system component VasF